MSKYSDILKRNKKNNSADLLPETTEEKCTTSNICAETVSAPRKKRFPGKKYNYDTWERAYFSHILSMRDICARTILENIIGIEPIFLCSDAFLEKFARFLYSNSSKTISKFLEPLTKAEEERYLTFKTLRTQ